MASTTHPMPILAKTKKPKLTKWQRARDDVVDGITDPNNGLAVGDLITTCWRTGYFTVFEIQPRKVSIFYQSRPNWAIGMPLPSEIYIKKVMNSKGVVCKAKSLHDGSVDSINCTRVDRTEVSIQETKDFKSLQFKYKAIRQFLRMIGQ